MATTLRELYDFIKSDFPDFLTDKSPLSFLAKEEYITDFYELSFEDVVEFSLINTTQSEGGYMHMETAVLELDVTATSKTDKGNSKTIMSIEGGFAQDFLIAILNK